MKNFLAVLALSTVIASQAFATNLAYMTVKGVKQGQFKGEGTVAAHKDTIAVLNFNYEVVSPRDAATGQATGKRQHKPVVITKEWGAASPQLLQALVTNEVLSQVVIEFSEPAANGVDAVTSTVRLTNASVSDVNQSFQTVPGDAAPKNIQTVSFTFQKIEITDAKGSTTFSDDWNAQTIAE